MKSVEITPERLQECWDRALKVWGLAIQVDLPTLDPDNEALAYIDLSTRRVTINPRKLAALNALDSLDGVLAHELGHHLKYPGSLSTQARLELLEREILPLKAYSLLNLFTDFLINTELVRNDPAFRDDLSAVYRGMPKTKEAAAQDPAFFFYLTCFEEAWLVAPRFLTGEAGVALEEAFPGCRAEAQQLAEELPNLAPNLFTQFIYFASVVSRYQVFDPEKQQADGGKQLNPTASDHSAPTAGDYADALRRSAQESEAIRRAIKEGWLKPDKIPDGAQSETIRAGVLPGVLAGEPKKLAETMALHYRRLAERYLFKPPTKILEGEPIVPSTLSPWEHSDSPKEIDWIGTILAAGQDLGVIQPLKRDKVEDDPVAERKNWRARLEIYLDVSGSMPDPKAAINPMTLAAQVLCMSALRHGGSARALIYSTNFVQHWTWTRSEMEMSKFLMNYIGGGTDFPFAVLAKSIEDCGLEQPVRIVLTDSDFSYNLKGHPKLGPPTVAAAAARTPFIALLNGARNIDEVWVKEIAATGARVIPVPDMAGFPQTAAILGEALFGDSAPAPRRLAPLAAKKGKA